MKEKQISFISGALCIVLMLLLTQIGKVGYAYYKSPTCVAEEYIKALENKNYSKAYKLLATSSLDASISKEELISYYYSLYHKELVQTRLIENVKLKSKDLGSCKAVYTYRNQNKEEVLELIKENNTWKVSNPFKSSEITIYAPADTKIYLNGKTVTAKGKNCFSVEGLLPGKYMLQAKFSNKNYKDYYQVIKIPEEKEVILPYETVDIEVRTVKGLEVNLGTLSQMATKNKVDFSDVLPGTYTLIVKSPYGVIEPIKKQIEVGKSSSQVNCNTFKLSQKGNEEKEAFINDFYQEYLLAIETGNSNGIKAYFNENKQAEELKLFEEWFVEHKDIQNVKLKVENQLNNLDENGYLNGNLTEIIDMTNKEDDENGNKTNQEYQLVLKWHTQIDVMGERWKIVDRKIIESIVAYKDKDDRWIQY